MSGDRLIEALLYSNAMYKMLQFIIFLVTSQCNTFVIPIKSQFS